MIIAHALSWPPLPWIIVVFLAILTIRYACLYRQAEHRREHDRKADQEYEMRR